MIKLTKNNKVKLLNLFIEKSIPYNKRTGQFFRVTVFKSDPPINSKEYTSLNKVRSSFYKKYLALMS